MIFYLAVDENGHQHLAGTQADARAINKDFEQIDIPTDKAGLMAYVQNLLNQPATHPLGVEMPEISEEGVIDITPIQKVLHPEPDPFVADRASIEEVWPNLPIAFRFHLCSLTMEDARNVDWNGTAPKGAPQR